jgi:hypothetical protein
VTAVVPNGESFFRGVHYSISFKSKAFDQRRFWALRPAGDDHRIIETSVIWERFAPTLGHVNAYGCRLSLTRNRSKKAEGKVKAKDRDVYCGAYQFKIDHVRRLVGLSALTEVAAADVAPVKETDEIAHCNLWVRLNDTVDVEAAETVKTAIIDRLWQANRGPIRHTCADDLTPHPSGALVVPPSGAYFDDRSPIRRIWHLVRFVCYVWWVRTASAE